MRLRYCMSYMPQSNARILVFARRANGARQIESLERRIAEFFEKGPNSEPIDKLLFGTHLTSKIADYLIDQRRLIVELKTVKGDPSERAALLLRNALAEEPRMTAYGRLGVQFILKKRPNGREINRQLVNISGRAVRQLLQKANTQIQSTRKHFTIPNATGLVVLVLDIGQTAEAGVVAHAVRHAIFAENKPLSDIDYVWVTMENHTIRLPDGGIGFPEMLIWREAELPERTKRLVGNMLDAWSARHKSDLVHIDHTGSWDALRPADPQWRADLNIYR